PDDELSAGDRTYQRHRQDGGVEHMSDHRMRCDAGDNAQLIALIFRETRLHECPAPLSDPMVGARLSGMQHTFSLQWGASFARRRIVAMMGARRFGHAIQKNKARWSRIHQA